MSQLRMLTTEHRFIVSVLDAIDPLTVDRAEGSSVSAVPFLELEHFVRVFADGAHHAKEERVLFKRWHTGGSLFMAARWGACWLNMTSGEV